MLDLLQTGKYGVLTQQKLLGTTSNNISNVNTTGYVRQETLVYTSALDWGIGSTVTRRLYDQYVQRELFRDQGSVGFYDAYSTGLGTVDNLLSNEDTSISSSMDKLFASMQTSVQNTPSIASRQELLSRFENLVDRYHTINYNVRRELNDINAKTDDAVTTINDLVGAFYEVNQRVRSLSKEGLQTDIGLQLVDERDRLVSEISNYVDLNVTTESDGSYTLYLGNGQLLASGDAYALLRSKNNYLDNSVRDVSLEFQVPKKTELEISFNSWGGKLGGYLSAADEMRQAMRDLGQHAIAFADAMNEQNKGGVTLEGLAGKDLITIPEVNGTCSNNAYGVTVTFNKGEGSEVRNVDYQAFYNDRGDLEIYMIDADGNKTKLDASNFIADEVPNDPANPAAGTHLEVNMTGYEDNNGNYVKGHGITLKFDHSADEMRDASKGANRLLFNMQPTLNAAYDVKLNISKPEDFAFASAVRVNQMGHAGTAEASLVGVYGADIKPNSTQFGVYNDPDTGKPALTTNAPNYVRYETDADGTNGRYEVYHVDVTYDKDGKPVITNEIHLGTAPKECNGKEIFANTTWNNDLTGPFAGEARDLGYPGYEVNFTNGTVVNGSSFYLELNLDGENDNSNGNLLAQLQQEDLVFSTEHSRCTFTEGYADLTSALGSAVMSATTDLAAAQAKCTQSQSLFSSAAGVNLNEEAANLIRYQQSYSACARIISASQTVFNSLIGALM